MEKNIQTEKDKNNNEPYTVHIDGIGKGRQFGEPDIEKLVRLLLKYDEVIG